MSLLPRTLVLLAHPNLASSRLNRALADAVIGMPHVTVRDLASVRGTNGYDVAVEQQILVEHDSIVLQFPWYWDAVPALLKEWMEQVLTYGFAYGSDATALRGKPLQVVTTTGAPALEYRSEGLHLATMTELMRPLDATANVCEMEFVEPFVVHGARSVDDAALASYSSDYRRLIESTQQRPRHDREDTVTTTWTLPHPPRGAGRATPIRPSLRRTHHASPASWRMCSVVRSAAARAIETAMMTSVSRRRDVGDVRPSSGRPVRPGIAALVAGGCAVVVSFQMALTSGAPLGAAALGGVDTGRLSNELRVVTAVSAAFWSGAALLALSRGSRKSSRLPESALWWGTWALAVVLGMSALMNFASSSSWERFGWGPFSLMMWGLCVVLARSGLPSQPHATKGRSE